MNIESQGPIISKGDTKKDKQKSLIMKVIIAFVILFSWGYWLADSSRPIDETAIEEQEANLPTIIEELEGTLDEESIEKLEEELVEPITPTVESYYERALEREKAKDYQGASEDYTETIALAKKYSSEMWNSLNNRGIIKAQNLNDYKGAIADFSRIIEIETNRSDGNINTTRLEAGYTNRAYVKKMRGDVDGACDDLYEALGLGVESSVQFIEKQIDDNCL